jgi:membrane protease YdiL (CAAX protease family)
VVTPLYVIASGVLSALQGGSMVAHFLAAAGTALIVFIVVPLLMARYQGVQAKPGFQLVRTKPLFFVVAAILGATVWPLAYDSIILCQNLEIGTLNIEKLAEQNPELLEWIAKLPKVPPAVVLFSFALVPGIAEELFFRGYLLGALRGKLPAWLAIALTALVFGLFHANVGGIIAVERVLSSTLLGLVLGFICWTTHSVYPGMVLHILNNAIMFSLPYLAPRLQSWGLDIEDQKYLPPSLVVATTILAAAAVIMLIAVARRSQSTQTAPS